MEENVPFGPSIDKCIDLFVHSSFPSSQRVLLRMLIMCFNGLMMSSDLTVYPRRVNNPDILYVSLFQLQSAEIRLTELSA